MQNPTRLIPALLLLLLAPASYAAVASFTGETVVRTISTDRIAVLVDTNGDAMVDRGFLLSLDLPAGPVAERFASASVEQGEGYVRVVAPQQIFDLQVAGYPDPPPPAAGSKVVTLIGYSLVNSSGDSGCDVERAFEHDPGACFAYGRD